MIRTDHRARERTAYNWPALLFFALALAIAILGCRPERAGNDGAAFAPVVIPLQAGAAVDRWLHPPPTLLQLMRARTALATWDAAPAWGDAKARAAAGTLAAATGRGREHGCVVDCYVPSGVEVEAAIAALSERRD